MLTELYIENVLLIPRLLLNFKSGLTVITGQTGSGKSIILDSLGIILGDRASPSMIRTGCDKAVLSASFDVSKSLELLRILSEYGIDDSGIVTIRKVITANGSKIFINDAPTTINFIGIIRGYLVQIHSQLEQMDLMSSGGHIDVLDDFGKLKDDLSIMNAMFLNVKRFYDEYIVLKTQLDQLKTEVQNLDDCVKDLQALKLSENELDALTSRRKLLTDGLKIASSLENAASIFYEAKISANVVKVQSNLEKALLYVKEFDTNLAANIESVLVLSENVISAASVLQEGINGLNFSYSESELNEIEDRIAEINQVARKYRVSPDQLETFILELKEKVLSVDVIEANVSKKYEEYNIEYSKCLEFAKQLSVKRKEIASTLESKIVNKLGKLKMEFARFVVDFKEVEMNKYGIDTVVFLASMNPGLDLSPIHKIASGGELSRFMLAIKSTIAEINLPGMIVFDEIDTGVSGSVAHAIGEELLNIAKGGQVLCISHNTQIAALADNHFTVYKTQSVDSTITTVKELDIEERIAEIASMISGSETSGESKMHAEGLLSTARLFKASKEAL